MLQFSSLLPDLIFRAVEEQGFYPTGVLFPLNSYENRVYEIGLEEHPPVIAKFYRPDRWSMEALRDEHLFMAALAEAEVPVVTPLNLTRSLPQVETLGQIEGMFYTIYPKFRGRENPDLNPDDRRWLGRTLARLHNVGASFPAANRPFLTPETYGHSSLQFILTQEFLPSDLKESIHGHLVMALKLTEPAFHSGLKTITVHGDCHPGNILWNRDGPYLVDFDDMLRAPPVQDVWMLFYGDEEEKRIQRDSFFEGYEMFRSFDYSTLRLIEPLRTLRMIHHAAWIGKRYHEPTFQRAFPYYQQRRYWEEFLLSIKEQIGLLQEM